MSKKLFLPVVHVTSDEQALNQAKIAFDNGADGIFLIDHKRKYPKLIKSYTVVREQYKDKWIGLNFLDLKSIDAVEHVPFAANALWIDDGGWYRVDDTLQAEVIKSHAELNGNHTSCYKPWSLFSGFEFKYQPKAANLSIASQWANNFTDTPVTIGDGTGIAADIEKIKTIREQIGNQGLAIASGVTVENVNDYLPYIDYFMVATGISKSFNEFDPTLVNKMATLINK